MNRPNTEFYRIWENPKPQELGNTVEEFLQKLAQPTLIVITGTDDKPARAISTLLHGNEPSGVLAMFHWLKHGEKPKTTLLLFISAVQTALQAPGFYYRQLPGKRDLNRCFKPPFDTDEEGKTAQELLMLLDYYDPECVIDIHNTSGKGEPFSVSTECSPILIELASFFTRRMIITDLRLGALSDLHSTERPIITIECGGSRQETSHQLALEGLTQLANADVIQDSVNTDHVFELLHNPVRVELKHEVTIDYLSHKNTQVDITLMDSIEQHNFGIAKPFHSFGWTSKRDLSYLQAINSRGQDVIHQILEIRDGEIYPRRPIKIFMATTNPTIAKNDCLFYVVDIEGKEIVETPDQ